MQNSKTTEEQNVEITQNLKIAQNKLSEVLQIPADQVKTTGGQVNCAGLLRSTARCLIKIKPTDDSKLNSLLTNTCDKCFKALEEDRIAAQEYGQHCQYCADNILNYNDKLAQYKNVPTSPESKKSIGDTLVFEKEALKNINEQLKKESARISEKSVTNFLEIYKDVQTLAIKESQQIQECYKFAKEATTKLEQSKQSEQQDQYNNELYNTKTCAIFTGFAKISQSTIYASEHANEVCKFINDKIVGYSGCDEQTVKIASSTAHILASTLMIFVYAKMGALSGDSHLGKEFYIAANTIFWNSKQYLNNDTSDNNWLPKLTIDGLYNFSSTLMIFNMFASNPYFSTVYLGLATTNYLITTFAEDHTNISYYLNLLQDSLAVYISKTNLAQLFLTSLMLGIHIADSYIEEPLLPYAFAEEEIFDAQSISNTEKVENEPNKMTSNYNSTTEEGL
jgi:hypothetical protein